MSRVRDFLIEYSIRLLLSDALTKPPNPSIVVANNSFFRLSLTGSKIDHDLVKVDEDRPLLWRSRSRSTTFEWIKRSVVDNTGREAAEYLVIRQTVPGCADCQVVGVGPIRRLTQASLW